jgi:hypothetical protein
MDAMIKREPNKNKRLRFPIVICNLCAFIKQIIRIACFMISSSCSLILQGLKIKMPRNAAVRAGHDAFVAIDFFVKVRFAPSSGRL